MHVLIFFDELYVRYFLLFHASNMETLCQRGNTIGRQSSVYRGFLLVWRRPEENKVSGTVSV